MLQYRQKEAIEMHDKEQLKIYQKHLQKHI